MKTLILNISDKLNDTQALVQAMIYLAANNRHQDLTGENVATLLSAIEEKLQQAQILTKQSH